MVLVDRESRLRSAADGVGDHVEVRADQVRRLVAHFFEAGLEVVGQFLQLRQVRHFLIVRFGLVKLVEDPERESADPRLVGEGSGQLGLVGRPEIQGGDVRIQGRGQFGLQLPFDRLPQPRVAPPAEHGHQSRDD